MNHITAQIPARIITPSTHTILVPVDPDPTHTVIHRSHAPLSNHLTNSQVRRIHLEVIIIYSCLQGSLELAATTSTIKSHHLTKNKKDKKKKLVFCFAARTWKTEASLKTNRKWTWKHKDKNTSLPVSMWICLTKSSRFASSRPESAQNHLQSTVLIKSKSRLKLWWRIKFQKKIYGNL